MALLYLSLPLRGQRMRRPFRLLVDVVSFLSECRQAVTHALYRMFMGVGTWPGRPDGCRANNSTDNNSFISHYINFEREVNKT